MSASLVGKSSLKDAKEADGKLIDDKNTHMRKKKEQAIFRDMLLIIYIFLNHIKDLKKQVLEISMFEEIG